MSLQMHPGGASLSVAADERALLRQLAPPIARAARLLIKQRRTELLEADLQAQGMVAVWSKLPSYDSARAPFERWAFYMAFRAMVDASRSSRRETLFEAALSTGAQGYIANDDRPAERDFHNDTPETDFHRLRARTRRTGVAAWMETHLEAAEGGAPVERALHATEAVKAVHEEVAALPEEQRTYLHLRFWNDTDVQEVAARMDISERTLRRRWAEARDLLHARLRARGIFGTPPGFGEAADALALAGEAPR